MTEVIAAIIHTKIGLKQTGKPAGIPSAINNNRVNKMLLSHSLENFSIIISHASFKCGFQPKITKLGSCSSNVRMQ